MKRLAAILLTTMGSVGAVHANSGGTITFNGEVTATTCEVKVNGLGTDATVMLPTVSESQLAKAGQSAGRTKFTLFLGNCSGSLKTATAFFEDGPSVTLAGSLSNVGGTANNVDLRLLDGGDAANQPIIIGQYGQVNSNSYTNIENGMGSLPYLVEYLSTGTATAGSVISNVVYSIHYK